MPSRRLAALVSLGLSAIVLVPITAGCGGEGEDAQAGDEANLEAAACQLFNNVTGERVDRSKLDDPFARVYLRNAAGCSLQAAGVVKQLGKIAGAPASTFVVSEVASNPTSKTPYRFVLSQPTSTTKTKPKTTNGEDLFVSVLGSAGGLADLVEVMSFSPSLHAYRFYTVEGGQWNLMGDGTQITPGAAPAFRCAECHTTGSPVFKELRFPWNNWNSTESELPEPPGVKEPFATLFREKGDAYELEGIVGSGTARWATDRAKAALAGKREGQSLKTLLTQVMCDTGEGTLISSSDKNGKNGLPAAMIIPESFLVDRALTTADGIFLNVPGLFGITLKGDAYTAALDANLQTVNGKRGDTSFAFFVPERSSADIGLIDALLHQKVLNRDVATDMLMIDFTTAVFSKERCALAGTVPESAGSAEELRTSWLANLKSSNLAGAAALSGRLANKSDFAAHEKAVNEFVDACAARASGGPNFARDMLKLASQRRREFLEIHGALVESAALLPDDALKDAAPHTWRLDPTTCKLVKQ